MEYCHKCGYRLEKTMSFCPKCGSKRYEDLSVQNGEGDKSKVERVSMPRPTSRKPQKTKLKKVGCGCIIIFVLFSIIMGVLAQNVEKSSGSVKRSPVSNNADQKKTLNPEKEKPHRAVVQKGAVRPIPTEKGKGYDKTLAKYGVDGVKKINSLLPVVAEKAASSKKMDIIWIVDLSDSRSTKDELVFYADAKNGNRVYISEKELEAGAALKTEREKLEALLPSHIEMCEKFIKRQLAHPSTYDKHFFSSGAQTDDRINRILITFSAKNSFNLETVYEALFIVNVDGEITYHSIKEKQ